MRARTDPRHMPSMLRTPTRARHHRPLTHTRPRCPLPSSRRVDRCHPITAYATARPLGANTTHPPTDHDAPLGDQAITSNREYSASSRGTGARGIEFFGNTILLNATWPTLDVQRRRYRSRSLNGATRDS
jgi:hypothetical protein